MYLHIYIYIFAEEKGDKAIDRQHRLARDALKQLNSLSFNTTDIAVLKNIEQSVKKVINEIETVEKIPSSRFILLRKRVSSKKYAKRLGWKSSLLKKHSKIDISKGTTQ